MQIKELLTRWVALLKEHKRYSVNTVVAYEKDVQHFLDFLINHEGGGDAAQLALKADMPTLRSWLASRKLKGYDNRSTARAISSVKSFYNFLFDQTGVKNLAIRYLKQPRQNKLLPKALSEMEVQKALAHEDSQGQDWCQLRDQAILYTLYGTGMRISECLSLTKARLHSEVFYVVGKGGKSRVVPILPIVREKIKLYLSKLPWQIAIDDPMFVGSRGGKLSAAVFSRKLVKMRKSLNLPEYCTSHAFRHSFATHLLENGSDLRIVQELLGHATVASTQVYTQISLRHLKKMYNSAHPFAKDIN